MVDVSSTHDPHTGVLATHLCGNVTTDDVEQWIGGLDRTVELIASGERFKLLVDLSAYEPASLDAHKAMRNVIPEFLARHGLRPAYVDLFDDRPEVTVASTPRVRCVAMVNVHHNADRMDDYQCRAGTPEQRFMSSLAEAVDWITPLDLEGGLQ